MTDIVERLLSPTKVTQFNSAGVLETYEAEPSAMDKEAADEIERLRAASKWQPIETAPKDRPILLWFPDGDFACKATWETIEGGDEDGGGTTWAWMIADELSEQHDGVVWSDSAQPTLWQHLPSPPTNDDS